MKKKRAGTAIFLLTAALLLQGCTGGESSLFVEGEL